MAASGICHTDLSATSIPPPYLQYPRVAGHEGSGYVKAIGSNISRKVLAGIAVGDPVLLSFMSCESCSFCKSQQPNCCRQFMELNIMSNDPTFRSADGQSEVCGNFFGQSSFSNLSIVHESCVLPAKNLIKSNEELKLFAPLGCGLQTGAGAVLNVAKASKNDSVMVIGLGGVGWAALMAAKVADCREIIAVDIVESRIEMAMSLSATKTLNTKNVLDIATALREAANDGAGPNIVIETSGNPKATQAAYEAVNLKGALVFVGAPADPAATLTLSTRDALIRQIKLIGTLDGDSLPDEFIPELVEYYRQGRFPIEKITRYYKAEDFKTALHDMHTGETIKPVLVW